MIIYSLYCIDLILYYIIMIDIHFISIYSLYVPFIFPSFPLLVTNKIVEYLLSAKNCGKWILLMWLLWLLIITKVLQIGHWYPHFLLPINVFQKHRSVWLQVCILSLIPWTFWFHLTGTQMYQHTYLTAQCPCDAIFSHTLTFHHTKE